MRDSSNDTAQFQASSSAERQLFTITTASLQQPEPNPWLFIYSRLPMFFEQVLYPDYDRTMTVYKREAEILTEYMKEMYRTKPYQVENNGLIRFPLEDRWLRGEEYGFLLRHHKTYEAVGKYLVHLKS